MDLYLNAYKNQQREIKETERFIERFRYKNTKATQVQSRIKKLEKLEILEEPSEDNSSIRLKISIRLSNDCFGNLEIGLIVFLLLFSGIIGK